MRSDQTNRLKIQRICPIRRCFQAYFAVFGIKIADIGPYHFPNLAALAIAYFSYIALFAPKKFKIDPKLGCFCGLFVFISTSWLGRPHYLYLGLFELNFPTGVKGRSALFFPCFFYNYPAALIESAWNCFSTEVRTALPACQSL